MSYTSQQFLPHDSSTLALFKTWAQAISSAFSSCGWTQTSDTGQVNWSTIASVPASGSFVYEVWKPTDSLQTGNSQFFLKVDYGQGSGGGPRVRFTVSTSTDGAGNSTGTISAVFDPCTNAGGASATGTVYDCYFCGDVNRFCLMMWRSLSSNVYHGSGGGGFLWAIERTHDTTGVDTTDGVTAVEVSRNNITRGQETIVFGFGPSPMGRAFPDNPAYVILGLDPTNNANGDSFFTVIPCFPNAPLYGKVGNAMTQLIWLREDQVPEGSFFPTTIYGAVQTYIATRAWNNGLPAGAPMSCMRFS